MLRGKNQSRTIAAMSAALVSSTVLMAACTRSDAGTGAAVTVFEGARLIIGDGSPPIEDAVFIVGDAGFTQVGRRADVQIPEGSTRVDLSGKTVMPAIVNAHVHLATEREERVEQLQHLRFGGGQLRFQVGRQEPPWAGGRGRHRQRGSEPRQRRPAPAVRALSQQLLVGR